MNTQTAKESKNLTPVQPLQITQINVESIPLKAIIRSDDPLEPLVSAEIEENVNGQFINIKIVVFVPQTLLGQEPISLYQDLATERNELKFVVKCNSTELVADNYYSWYVNYLYPIAEGTPEIDTIITRIEDLIQDDSNPKTKRGTVTRILQS